MRGFRLVAALLLGCGGTPAATTTPAQLEAADTPAAAAKVEEVSLADVGLAAERLDRSADPCDDFYRFACGGWLDATPLPADEAAWGTFHEINRRNQTVLHKILDDAARAPGDDPVSAKLGAFYGGCLDEDAIARAGTSAIDPFLRGHRQARDLPSLVTAVAALHRAGVGALFEVYPQQDKKDAARVIATVSQGGLGMPDRDYYLGADENMRALRAAYATYVERVLVLLGRKPAEARRLAAAILALETDLARTHKTAVEMRDEEATYHKVDRQGLARLAPRFPWDAYFAALGLHEIGDVNLPAPKAIEALAAIVQRHRPAVWQAYLDLHTASAFAVALPRRFDDERFAWERHLQGQKEQQARWKRCIALANHALPELLAQPFVAAAFSGDSKAAADEMVREIVAAFERNLGGVDWMDQATKERAREKLRKLDVLIGYPERWRSYDFAIDRGRFAEALIEASRFEQARLLAKIGKPVDRNDWQMPPAIVNAYYDPQLNQMAYPAGILQRPFYDVRASVAANLGGLGMIVGHELTHGFDDQGALYDAGGNLSGWWPDEVTAAFRDRTRCTAEYYSRYEVLPGLALNGELTNGENIADMGGTRLAFRAYRALRQHAPTRFVADGYTEDQQFFIALGQAWCEKSSPEYLRFQVAVDPHSPPRQRVLGSLSSLPEFWEAFACQPGAGMRPEKVCEVW